MRAFMCLCMVSILSFMAVNAEAAWPIVQLTDNDYDDTMPQVSGNNVAWMGGSDYETEVFIYDGAAVRQLTDGSFSYRNSGICVDGNRVAWTGWGGSGEIFLYDGHSTRQITDNDVPDNNAVLWDGGIAWRRDYGTNAEVFNYDGTSTVQLTDDDYEQYSISASGQYIGWATEEGKVTRVMRYDGQTIKQVTEDTEYFDLDGIMLSEENVLLIFRTSKSYHRLELCTPAGREEIPMRIRFSAGIDLYGSRVVWGSYETAGYEIFLYDGNQIIQITEDEQDDWYPCVSDSLIAWSGSDGNDSEIFLYDGSNIMQVTDNDSGDWNLQLSGSTLAWQHWDGNDWEIQMVTVPEPSCVVLMLVGLLCFGTWRTHGLYVKKL